jgi:hypothetical protein
MEKLRVSREEVYVITIIDIKLLFNFCSYTILIRITPTLVVGGRTPFFENQWHYIGAIYYVYYKLSQYHWISTYLINCSLIKFKKNL